MTETEKKIMEFLEDILEGANNDCDDDRFTINSYITGHQTGYRNAIIYIKDVVEEIINNESRND